uniref:Uncharacterized protein n=1 Tax=Lygus hesperus TaxID=30085 RepID=A0A146L178_LYGHE
MPGMFGGPSGVATANESSRRWLKCPKGTNQAPQPLRYSKAKKERRKTRRRRRRKKGMERAQRQPCLYMINIDPPDFSHTEPLDWARTRVLALEGILVGLNAEEARTFALTIVHWLCCYISDVFRDRPVPRSLEELEEFIYPNEQ